VTGRCSPFLAVAMAGVAAATLCVQEVEVRIEPCRTDGKDGDSMGLNANVLEFVCLMSCSVYNMNSLSLATSFPPWKAWCLHASQVLFPSLHGVDVIRRLYWLTDTPLPPQTPHGPLWDTGGLGTFVFAFIWSYLPVAYTLMFGYAYIGARGRLRCVQRFMCLWGIFHFLFITDLVNYCFGRGLIVPESMHTFPHWAHWSERFVWRWAIILFVVGHLERSTPNALASNRLVQLALLVAMLLYFAWWLVSPLLLAANFSWIVWRCLGFEDKCFPGTERRPFNVGMFYVNSLFYWGLFAAVAAVRLPGPYLVLRLPKPASSSLGSASSDEPRKKGA